MRPMRLAHHWGTFRLTDEAIDEPPKRLAVALERAKITPDRFATRRPGEMFDVPLSEPASRSMPGVRNERACLVRSGASGDGERPAT